MPTPSALVTKGVETMSSMVGTNGGLTAIQREGLEWVQLLVSGKATRDDLAALARWRERSQDHNTAFVSAARIHNLVGQHEITEKDVFTPSILERASTRRSALAVLLTTGVAGYGFVRPPLGLWPSLAELSADYRTTTGQHQQVEIASGVALELNTRSSVSRRSYQGQPGIELVAGEVAISSQLDGDQKFTAVAGQSRVMTGTGSFDLRLNDNGACVTCLGGAILVEFGSSRISLAPEQQVVIADGRMQPATRVDVAVVTAWRQGQLVFHDAPLTFVISEINRYRPGRIVLLNNSMAQTRFSGEFAIARLDGAIDHIAKVAHVSVTRWAGGVVTLG